jgi:hypothetical protein
MRPRTPPALSTTEAAAAVACVRAGRSMRRVALLFGCSDMTIAKYVRLAAPPPPLPADAPRVDVLSARLRGGTPAEPRACRACRRPVYRLTNGATCRRCYRRAQRAPEQQSDAGPE